MRKLLSVTLMALVLRGMGGRAPGGGGQLCWWGLDTLLPGAPGVWGAR